MPVSALPDAEAVDNLRVEYRRLLLRMAARDLAHEVGVDDEEQYVLRGDMLDLEPVLRDAVVPALPFQPVCRQDCPGLCSECGAHLADDPDHAHDSIDPRWAALQALAPTVDPPPRTNEKRN